MSDRFFPTRLLPAALFLCICLPSEGQAQHRHSTAATYSSWSYYGLPGGPYTTTEYPFRGWPGYRGANGLHPHRPEVQVYAPLPSYTGGDDVHPVQSRPGTIGLGVGYFGWVGPYRASPRPRPVSVSVWP